MLDEFKKFAMRGNVVDMAVGTSPIKVGKFSSTSGGRVRRLLCP
jgi:hypothetical protein